MRRGGSSGLAGRDLVGRASLWQRTRPSTRSQCEHESADGGKRRTTTMPRHHVARAPTARRGLGAQVQEGVFVPWTWGCVVRSSGSDGF